VKYNNIGNDDEDKRNMTEEPLFENYKKTR
jgi:hypothetical protein